MASMYFIAFVLPTDINKEVLKWKLFMNKHFNCFVALRSPAHITLVPPFWMNDDLENKLENSISQFSQNQSSFQINLKNFAAFNRRLFM